VIAVAGSNLTDDQIRARARDSLEHSGGVDEEAFAKLASLLHYVGGDYNGPERTRHSALSGVQLRHSKTLHQERRIFGRRP
jgi:glucose-6-phosphate 1-dehydrogenase